MPWCWQYHGLLTLNTPCSKQSQPQLCPAVVEGKGGLGISLSFGHEPSFLHREGLVQRLPDLEKGARISLNLSH